MCVNVEKFMLLFKFEKYSNWWKVKTSLKLKLETHGLLCESSILGQILHYCILDCNSIS